jgi:SNF2 family DNA or RNA helicase
MTSFQLTQPPSIGQVVRIRQRLYVVSQIVVSSLAESIISSKARTQPQHLISLNAIEDDALGETLQIVWELEPGTQIIEKSELPTVDGFDEPQRLEAFLDSVLWGAVSQADRKVLQAPFRSGIDLENYQLSPLVRSIQMPRTSLLIADDVGLGKTIEAGLVTQELIIRNRARRVLIICPAGLLIHWREQMRDKFGLEFRVVDSQLGGFCILPRKTPQQL